MTGQSYRKCMDWTARRLGIPLLRLLVKLLTMITAACYGMTVGWLLFRQDFRLIRMIAVPAAGFAAVSFFRELLSASRPYEVYGFTPLLEKDTRGNSFPSRHVFSNMIIAMAVLWVWRPAGIFLIGCGILLAVLRVIAGVHFPRDVIAGALAAVLLGITCFFIL